MSDRLGQRGSLLVTAFLVAYLVVAIREPLVLVLVLAFALAGSAS